MTNPGAAPKVNTMNFKIRPSYGAIRHK